MRDLGLGILGRVVTRKAQQAAARELLRAGATDIRWSNGAKHRVVTALFDGGMILKVGFHHAQVDETMTRQIVRSRLKAMRRR